MSFGKIIAFIGAAILILFGVLLILGALDPINGQTFWIFPGLILIGAGFGLIYFAARRPAPKPGEQTVTYKVDLPGNVNMDSLKCKSCGGVLAPENISMVAGAPVVTCPYCKTVYQLTEEPKW
jgi:phage FluMu protein Com